MRTGVQRRAPPGRRAPREWQRRVGVDKPDVERQQLLALKGARSTGLVADALCPDDKRPSARRRIVLRGAVRTVHGESGRLPKARGRNVPAIVERKRGADRVLGSAVDGEAGLPLRHLRPMLRLFDGRVGRVEQMMAADVRPDPPPGHALGRLPGRVARCILLLHRLVPHLHLPWRRGQEQRPKRGHGRRHVGLRAPHLVKLGRGRVEVAVRHKALDGVGRAGGQSRPPSESTADPVGNA